MNEIARLRDVCEITMGQAPRGNTYNTEGNGWPLIAGAGDFEGSYPRPKKFTTQATKISEPGDIVLSIRASIGDRVLSDSEYCLGRGVAGLRPGPRLDQRYLWHWLAHSAPILASKGRGATFKQVNRQDIGEMPIPLPAKSLQQHFGRILDAIDQLRARRRETLRLLDDLTVSLFDGMFTRASDRRDWPSLTLDQAVAKGTIVTYGIVQAGDDYPGGVPYIRTGDIKDGRILTEQLRLTDPAIAARFARSRVETGDIVMSIRATVGTTALVTADTSGANLTQGTARISPGKLTEGLYLLYHLRSQKVQDWIARQVKGATFREITLAKLRELVVPLPPLSLQKTFVERVESIDRLRAIQLRHLVDLEGLFNSTQHRIFRGELQTAAAGSLGEARV